MIDSMIQNTDQYEILIVDDTLDNLELLGHILDERGYRVRPATNGRMALESAAVRLPDLILLDVKMPEMDGFEVCRHLKSNEKSRNVPVIFISAHGDTTDKVTGFKSGGVDYITKPFKREEVLARVENQLLLRKLTENLEQEVNKRTVELTLANQQLRQEITKRQRTEEKLSWEVQVNQVAAELSQKLLSPISIDDISYLILEYAKRLTGSSFGYAGYIDPETGYLVSPTHTKDVWDQCQVADKNIIFKEFTGLWGWVLNNRKSLLTNAPANDPRSSGTPHGHIPIHRFLSAPALIEESLVGQLSVANADHEYTDRELEVVERLANLYAIAIHHQHAEDELNRHRDQLETLVSERTAELEAFSYSVSHDLRAPLRHIDGFIELLRKKTTAVLDNKSRHYITNILDASKRMGMLIDDLLSFSRMGRQTLCSSDVDLQILVKDVVNEFEPELEGRTINWSIHKLPVVTTDPTLIRTVLVNLISNAIKYTRTRAIGDIEIGHNDEQTESVIYIRDNGVGFDMKYIDKLFGVFQRLHRKEEFEGIGIGLANVHRIINRHGGRVWAEAELDKGATFFFSLRKHVKKFTIKKETA